jgi:hypothetical protein
MYNIIKIKYPSVFVYFGILIVVLNSCTEPFDTTGVISDFESVLVIEATITNEFKQQQIRLTRTFEFEANGAPSESNAEVIVLDDQGNEFRFLETEPGLYLSEQVFEAQANRDYRLSVTTSDGRNYASRVTQLTQVTPIGEVVAERRINNEEEGMAILVNTFDPTNSSKFYRYEYEETFLIIAPDWKEEDLIASPNSNDCQVEVVTTGENNERVCYGTNTSNGIILTSTAGLVEDRVSEFMVRFVDRNNYIISHRYSILVRQFVQSSAAYSFFDTLKNLSESDNLFSQIQPGLLVGNVFSENNDNEIVLGYFDIASVSEERIFFDYDVFFPNEPLPPYISACNPSAPPIVGLAGDCELADFVRANFVEYLGVNSAPTEERPGPFLVVAPACGDCTVIGSNVVPPFWID